MKNSKYLMLAAIAAATAMVSSCSDNGDLSAPTKETEGKDLFVSASVNGSRATALTSTNFKGFKLFGFQNPQDGDAEAVGGFLNGANGVDFSGTIGNAWTTTATAKWPTINPNNSDNFFALSLQGGASLDATLDVSSLQGGIFSYTAPTTVNPDDVEDVYVAPADQKDLMVAACFDRLQSTKNGVVDLNFKHAFAYLTFGVGFSDKYYDLVTNDDHASTDVPENSKFAIDYYALHNVKVNGTYTFVRDNNNTPDDTSDDTWKGTWSPSGNGVIKYVYGTDDPLLLECDKTTVPTSTARFPYMALQKDATAPNVVMMVPQKINDSNDENVTWPADNVADNSTNYTYLEIHGVMWDPDASRVYNEAEDDYTDPLPANVTPFNLSDDDFDSGNYAFNVIGNGDGYRYSSSVYWPLPADFVFEANKKYNLRIYLPRFYRSDGQAFIEGAVIPD